VRKRLHRQIPRSGEIGSSCVFFGSIFFMLCVYLSVCSPRRLDAAQRLSAQEQEHARNLASQSSSRFLSKHKTRCVPDAPGMSILSKNEVKKDLRFLERNRSFSVRYHV